LVFLFWSISIGIICGAGFAELAVIMSLLLTVGIFLLDRFSLAKAQMMLVINSTDTDSEEKIIEVVKKHSKSFKIKSRNYSAGHLDLVIEVRVPNERDCIKDIFAIQGIASASLLAHDGEVTF